MFDVPWSGGNEILLATLTEIGLSNRLVASMKKDGIVLVGALVQQNSSAILCKQGLGVKSLREAKVKLAELGLSFGMDLQGWDDEFALQARQTFGRRVYKKAFELSAADWKEHDSLESELFALLLEIDDRRNAEMLSLLFGFNEEGPRTLESVGNQYNLTRERVRQIAARAEKKLQAIWRPTIHLFAANKLIASGVQQPFTSGEFSEAARKAGITKIDFHIEGVLQALQIIGERPSIHHTLLGGVSLYGEEAELLLTRELIRLIRKETSANGCTNIQRLALLAGMEIDDASKVRRLVSAFPEFVWLNSEETWLLSKRSTRNRLANIAGRIFSVAPSVEINELRTALLRPTRVTFVPPATVIANFLENRGIAFVQDGVAFAGVQVGDSELGINDMGIVLAFQELGSPLTREELEDYCLDDLGMNANSFYVYLSYSPFVVKLATGVFSLVGEDVDPGRIEQMKADIREKQSKVSHGWSKAGTLWWHFQADRPCINSGSHTTPTFVLNFASGEWKVKTVDGLKLGLVNVANGFISGLKQVFDVLGVCNKDFIQIDFEIVSRVVFVRIVGDEPVEFSYELEIDEFDQYNDLDDND